MLINKQGERVTVHRRFGGYSVSRKMAPMQSDKCFSCKFVQNIGTELTPSSYLTTDLRLKKTVSSVNRSISGSREVHFV